MKIILFFLTVLICLNLSAQIQVTDGEYIFGPTGIPSDPWLIIKPYSIPYYSIYDTSYTMIATFSLPLPPTPCSWYFIGVSTDFDTDANVEALYWVYDTTGGDPYSSVILRDLNTATDQLVFYHPDSFYYAWSSYMLGQRIFVVYNSETYLLYRSGISVATEEDPLLESDLELTMNLNRFIVPTEIKFNLPSEGLVELTVFDLSGRSIRNLANHSMTSGEHIFYWDGRDNQGRMLPNGNYFVVLKKDDSILEERTIILSW